jgi:hypothetical protein
MGLTDTVEDKGPRSFPRSLVGAVPVRGKIQQLFAAPLADARHRFPLSL